MSAVSKQGISLHAEGARVLRSRYTNGVNYSSRPLTFLRPSRHYQIGKIVLFLPSAVTFTAKEGRPTGIQAYTCVLRSRPCCMTQSPTEVMEHMLPYI